MRNRHVTRYDAVSHLLSRTALLAVDIGLDQEAERIVVHQRQVLADPAALDVSRAIVLIRRGEPELAVELLRDSVLLDSPNHGPANAVLGMALLHAGLPGGRECFDRVLAVSLDADTRAVALDGLQEA